MTHPKAEVSVAVVGYIRVSTDEQVASGAGLDAQRRAIEVEAARRAWHLVEVFIEAGASGRTLAGRDALADALHAVESGSASTLVVAKLDRLSRSLLDFAALMQRAQEGVGTWLRWILEWTFPLRPASFWHR